MLVDRSPDWIGSIVKQCIAARIPVYVKQLGTDWGKRNGTGRSDTKGADPHLWTEDLRVREFPIVGESICAS